MKRLGAALVLCAACSSAESPTTTSTTTTTGASTSATTSASGGAGGAAPIGGDRPVEVFEPSGLAPGERAPLVMLLHGYGVSGQIESLYMGLKLVVDEKKFFYVFPTGTVDSAGSYFWNATDACCNFDGSSVDDSAYLAGLIDEIVARYPVDPKRVYLIGHSNGGFMSYRMACDHADKIAGIASLAGAMWEDETKCAPSGPVHVLQIHGTDDTDVLYGGDGAGPGPGQSAYPGAETSAADWASIDGCDPTADTSAPPIDIEDKLDGAETTIMRWATGCKAGGSAELWSMQGGKHIPEIGASFRDQVLGHLFAHPKP